MATEITKTQIQKIAKLARIEITKTEEEGLTEQINRIIKFVDELADVDTANVEPLTALNYKLLGQSLRMEDDVVDEKAEIKEVIEANPNAKYGYFTVPKVLE